MSTVGVFWLGFATGGVVSMGLGFVVLLVAYLSGAFFANKMLGNANRKGGSNV